MADFLDNFYFDVTYEEAEVLLEQETQDGAFLIRPSKRSPGTFAISLRCNGKAHHHRIRVINGQYMCEGINNLPFKSMNELVEYYRQPNQGLVHHLTKPVSTEISEEEGEANYENSLKLLFKEIAKAIPSLQYPDEDSRLMQTYFNEGVCHDIDDIKTNTTERCTRFEELLTMFFRPLRREINRFNDYLNVIAQIISRTSQASPDALDFLYRTQTNEDCDLPSELTVDELINKMFSSQQLLTTINDRFLELLKADDPNNVKSPDNSSSGEAENLSDNLLGNSGHTQQVNTEKSNDGDVGNKPEIRLPNRSYKVSIISNKKKVVEAAIKVDSNKGLIEILHSSEQGTGISKILASEIYQVIKDVEDFKILKVIYGKGKFSQQEVLQFSDIRSAEQFFSAVEHLRGLDPSKCTEKVNIFVGTWNMGGNPPPDDIRSWLLCYGQGMTIRPEMETIFDIYAFGIQESPSITETEWIDKLKFSLYQITSLDYTTVKTKMMWGIKIVILCLPEIAFRITNVKSSCVRTGVANKLGNKGGVAVSFRLDNTNFCFINSHLAARAEEKKKRQENVQLIARSLNMGDLHPDIGDITHQFHHVFWFGDLNYRLDMSIPEVNNGVACRNFPKLYQVDQLYQEKLNGNVFVDWQEQSLNFPPTYRVVIGKDDVYETIKKKPGKNVVNVPSWCDRILWKSYPSCPMKCLAYGSVHDMLTSDHLPVFGLYQTSVSGNDTADIRKRFIRNPHKMPAYIVVLNAHAAIRPTKRYVAHFTLEFVSSCLENRVESAPNTTSWQLHTITSQIPSSAIPSNLVHHCPLWESSDLPDKMKAKYPFTEYLEKQVLLISLKAADSGEYIGACHLPLTAFMKSASKSYVANLTLYGEETGKLEISGYISL